MNPSALSQADARFLARRRTLSRLWPWVGSALALGWTAAFAYLAQTRPMLVDPRAVVDRLNAQPPVDDTIALLATMTPVLAWTVFAVVLAVIIVLFGYHFQERRLLRLVDTQAAAPAAGPAESSPPPAAESDAPS